MARGRTLYNKALYPNQTLLFEGADGIDESRVLNLYMDPNSTTPPSGIPKPPHGPGDVGRCTVLLVGADSLGSSCLTSWVTCERGLLGCAVCPTQQERWCRRIGRSVIAGRLSEELLSHYWPQCGAQHQDMWCTWLCLLQASTSWRNAGLNPCVQTWSSVRLVLDVVDFTRGWVDSHVCLHV